MIAWKVFLLVWCFFILSQGPICAYTAWKMWTLRKTYRVAHYTGMVMSSLFLTTSFSTYLFFTLLFFGAPRLVNGEVVFLKGLALFNNLSWISYTSLGLQALLSASLWAKGLYFLGKLR